MRRRAPPHRAEASLGQAAGPTDSRRPRRCLARCTHPAWVRSRPARRSRLKAQDRVVSATRSSPPLRGSSASCTRSTATRSRRRRPPGTRRRKRTTTSAVYWEPETKLLHRNRDEYWPHVASTNVFLSAGERNRKRSSTNLRSCVRSPIIIWWKATSPSCRWS